MGEYHYLRYADLGVRWDLTNAWFITVDLSVSYKSNNKIEGLCGTFNGDPYGTEFQ